VCGAGEGRTRWPGGLVNSDHLWRDKWTALSGPLSAKAPERLSRGRLASRETVVGGGGRGPYKMEDAIGMSSGVVSLMFVYSPTCTILPLLLKLTEVPLLL